MKKNIHSIMLLVIFISSLLASPVQASGTITIAAQGDQLPNFFALSQLGYNDTLMVGPFDSSSIYFSLPANIRLAPGSFFNLKFALAWSGGAYEETQLTGVGGTLLIYFNDELIDTIILTPDSPLEKEIFIPDSALNKADESGRQSLNFFLNADVNCETNDVRTTVIVSEDSQLSFQYEVVPPLADLTLFPRPIFQPDSILPSSALIVVPDNPEAFELQAALAAMTGIGSVTSGGLNIHLVTNSGLTQELVASNHLIFVGLAKNFPNLQAVNFPVPVSSSGLSLGQGNDTDGVIEISLSPWSQANVVMFVGGNSQDAVIKAGQAFSAGRIVAVEKPGLSLIKNVNPLVNAPSQEDQSFKDLGYEDQTVGVYGENYLQYVFYATAEQAASEGAYVDMVLGHSDLIDFDQTGITMILNDEVVGGLQISKESPATERVKLVPGILRRGFNRLEIVSDILPHFSCYSEDLLSTSVTISRTSNIHLPVTEAKLDFGKNVNLRDFPYMFLDSRDLSDLAFIVAPNDPVSWNYASRVAFAIGAIGNTPLANVHVMYADNVSEDALKEYNLLVFGLPSATPFISKINDLLPAPFKLGTNEAVQPSMLVNYGLLPDTSVGYLQLLPSPWNSDHVILAVSGNTLDGLPMAGAALLREDKVAQLSGNFAVMYADQVVSTDTRLGLGKESIISQLSVAVTVTPVARTNIPQSTNPQIEARPGWMLPLIGFVTAGILIFLVAILRQESSSKKRPKDGKVREETSLDSSAKNP